MRTGQPIIGRPAWYDRNPSMQAQEYIGWNLAPHAQTERWTYTVPAGKKAMVELLIVKVKRNGVATVALRPSAWISIVAPGPINYRQLYAYINTNGVGDGDVSSIGQSITLLAGWIIKGWTMDDSTGGTVDYILNAKITEFDA